MVYLNLTIFVIQFVNTKNVLFLESIIPAYATAFQLSLYSRTAVVVVVVVVVPAQRKWKIAKAKHFKSS